MSIHVPEAVVKSWQSSRWLNWLRNGLMALLALAWALAAHAVTANGDTTGWGAALALAPLGAGLVLMLFRWPSRLQAIACAVAVLGLLLASWPHLKQQVALLYYVEHLCLYLLMAIVFGRTLKGPGESLVTQLARRVHSGVLSPVQAVYTRKVTVAWCVFFLGMALVSSVLFWFSSVGVWSIFANFLGGPLLVVMFVGEFLYRHWALASENRQASMADAMRAWRSRDTDRGP